MIKKYKKPTSQPKFLVFIAVSLAVLILILIIHSVMVQKPIESVSGSNQIRGWGKNMGNPKGRLGN